MVIQWNVLLPLLARVYLAMWPNDWDSKHPDHKINIGVTYNYIIANTPLCVIARIKAVITM